MSYSIEMVLVGMILLSGMSFAGIRLWMKRRSETENLEKSSEPEETTSAA